MKTLNSHHQLKMGYINHQSNLMEFSFPELHKLRGKKISQKKTEDKAIQALKQIKCCMNKPLPYVFPGI